MTRTRRMKYNDDSSQDTDNSSAENIIPSVSKVNSPIPLNLAFDIVKPNPKDSCSVGDNYIETRYSVEDEVDSREREVEKIELEIRELQLRKRLLELTPNSSNKVRRPRETTELSGSRSEDKTSVVTASHRYTNVLLSDEMQFKAQVDSVKALCMSVSLPKIEIMKFDGSPLKFWTFMKGFKVNIVDRVNDDTQKLMYLIHYCEGIAKDAIEHRVLLPEKEGYTEAIKPLHERFGRPHDIVEAFLTELLSGSPLNQDDITGLQKLTRLMTNCKIALSQMGRNADLNCSTNIKRIVKQLPRSMQFKWAEAADDILRKGLEPNFDDLLQFLEKKVSIATNTYGQLASGSYKAQTTSNNRSSSIRAKIHTSSIKGSVHCVICSDAHEVTSCPQLLSVSHNEKVELLKKFKLCFNCLKPNHRATDCRQPVLCEIDGCKRRHHRILHNTEPDVKQACCNSTHTTGTYLGFVPVRLHGPTGYVDTYALLDNGSDSTLLLSDVAKQVGISGAVTRLNISSVIGASSQNAELTNFEIESLDKTNRIKIEGAYTIDNLPIKRAEIPPTDFQERWKHLKGVQLPSIACDKVGLLLGVDVPEAHWVLDQRIGKPKQPYASLTMLGWALFGPTDQLIKSSVFINGLEAKSSIEDRPTPPLSLATVAPENSSNRSLPFIDDPGLCLKYSPDVALLVDNDDVHSLIVAAAAVETEDSRVHQGLPPVRSSEFDTPPDSRSNRLIDTFDSVSKATDENLMDLEQVISLPAVDDEYLLKTANDRHVDTVVNIDLRCISPPDKILPTDSGELMSSKTSVMFSAETDLPGVSDVNVSAKSVILLHESSISCKATTTQFSANTRLVSPVVASAESSIDIKRDRENQKDDCFIQSADDDKKFTTTTSMSPLVGLDKQIQHPLPDFKDSRVATEMTHWNIEWHHNTPYANHHRVWERLIGSIRRPLSAVSMSYETLTTCLTEAERIPNDRPLLQTRPKWTQGRRDLQVRGPVLIIGDTYARNNWPKDLVVSFDPGGDGLWKQAKIRTWKGTIIRDICKICLLEGADDRKVENRETFQSDCG
ncbi:unnamed protein product [Schistosoma haematobium]|nr:unnamed protein product [Schistosoma haematobium]CAH8678926.1 unnamed protein product [Schistosoma haematobium]